MKIIETLFIIILAALAGMWQSSNLLNPNDTKLIVSSIFTASFFISAQIWINKS